MTTLEIVGHFGAFLSSVTFMPQVYKAWQTRSVGDLSTAMILIVFSSTVVWMVYGFGLKLWPVFICNAIICGLSLMLIYFKLTFKK
jgi:MtN3 and saliva related transmembrane protein